MRRIDDQMGEVIIQEPFKGTKRYPTYTCGHCSDVIMLRPDRTRERVKCPACNRLICEKRELCRKQCTPIHALAKDGDLAGDSHWNRLVPALMAGCSTEEEARKRGLLKD